MFLCFRRWLAVAAFLLPILAGNAAPSLGYYDSTAGKTGPRLRTALHAILTNSVVIPYTSTNTDVVDALRVLDEDPANTNNVLLIYTRRSDPKSSFNIAGGWNREHLWCNSYGLDYVEPAYSDLHNLRPEDVNVNSARGNKYYDFSNRADLNYRNPATSEALLATADTFSWEPPDLVKGDVARAMFYMDVRYAGDRTNELNLTLTDAVALINSTNAFMGRLRTLLLWHENDPPDDAERLRNDRVDWLYQHNRNPFVDHPEWVKHIYTTSSPTPMLSVAMLRGQNRFQLTWSQSDSNAVLETSGSMTGPWFIVTNIPIVSNGSLILEPNVTNTRQFYRLRVPAR